MAKNIFEDMLPWNNPNPTTRVEYVDNSAEVNRLKGMLREELDSKVHLWKRERELILMIKTLKRVIGEIIIDEVLEGDIDKDVRRAQKMYVIYKDEGYKDLDKENELAKMLKESHVERDYDDMDNYHPFHLPFVY